MRKCGGRNQEKRLLTNRAKNGNPSARLRHGLLMANVGLFLIIFSECDVLREGWHGLLYLGGGTLCVAGIIFVWIGVLNLAALGECLPRVRGTNLPRKYCKSSLARNDGKR
jgi:hypothetical protein